MFKQTFPSPETLKRFPFGLADVVVILGTLVLLGLIAQVGAGTLVAFVPPDQIPEVSFDPSNLPPCFSFVPMPSIVKPKV
jgi:NitT/TauT family transport system permease protein